MVDDAFATRSPRYSHARGIRHSGDKCGYGICCHFGLTCVNLHSPGEVEFFTKRQDLRLQLREMALEIEGKKISHSRAKLASRKPLLDCTNQTAQPSSRGAAPAQAKQPKKRASPPKRTPQPTAAATLPTVSARPVSPTRPPPPTPHATAMLIRQDIGVHPHKRCASMGFKCSKECSVCTTQDNPRWAGKWKPGSTYAVWARTDPPSWIRRHLLSLSVLLWIPQKGTPSLPIMVCACAGDQTSTTYGCMIITLTTGSPFGDRMV